MAYPILAPNSTWYKSSVARSTITQINIVDSYIPTGSENESWNADVDNTGSIKCYRTGTVLTIAGNGYGVVYANPDSSRAFSSTDSSNRFNGLTKITGGNLFDTSKAEDMSRMFQFCSSLETIDVSNWDTSKVTTMQNMFDRSSKLDGLNLTNWKVNEVTNMQAMFQACVSLSSLDLSNWNTGNVQSMAAMFSSPISLGSGPMALTSVGDLSQWNTSACTTMNSMFNNCGNLISIGNVSNWNVSRVGSMKAMFEQCSSLQSLDTSGWVPSACSDMSYMFNLCNSLTTIGSTTNWNTGNVTTMEQMFYGCTSLEELDVSKWNVSKVKTFQNMFGCGNDYGETPMKIKALDVSNWNTSSATDMSFMFYGCQGPGSIDVSGWDVSKVTTFDHMFAHSYLTVYGIENWEVSTAAVNLNCMFYSLKNKTIDVSKFNTSNVQFFCQMFQDSAVSEIIGLENFSTSNGLGFDEMFLNCTNLKELNLSSFDTTKAKDGVLGSANGSHYTKTLMDMLTNMPSLEKITFGEKFSFNGDGTTTANVLEIPIPSAENITGADGNWYTRLRESYAPTDIPSKTTQTYYASLNLVNDIDYLIKNGTLLDLADSVRSKANTYDYVSPIQMMNTIDNLKIDNYMNAEGVRF